MSREKNKQSLYVRMRPTTLRHIQGSRPSVKMITKQLEENDLPHFMIFHGPSGCGKTTMARIVADMLGANKSEIQEINGSTDNGIEMAREIESQYRTRPIMGKVKVFIIDEAHELTKKAYDGLLKPLEDTPATTYFIMCTTEPAKIPRTIKTRASEYSFAPLSTDDMRKVLARAIRRESMEISDETEIAVINASEGSARKALVLLDTIRYLTDPKDIERELQVISNDSPAKNIFFLIAYRRAKWNEIAPLLADIPAGEAESLRRSFLGGCTKAMLDMSKVRLHGRMADLYDCFHDNFYDQGKPGLIRACYDACQVK